MAIIDLSDELFNTLSHLADNRNFSIDALLEQLLTRDAIFENALDIMLVADDDMHYVDVNPAACDLLGYSRNELLEKHIYDVATQSAKIADDWETFSQDGKMRGEYQLKHKDGHEIVVEFVAVNSIKTGHHVSICRNVTDRKAVEEQLVESERRFKAFIDHAPMIAYLKNKNSDYLFTNQKIVDLIERHGIEFQNRTPFENLPQQLSDMLKEADATVLQQNTVVELDEYPIYPDDDELWFKEIKFPVKGIDDTIYIGGFAVDITETRNLRIEQQHILDRSPMPIGISTLDGEIEYYNDVFTESFGYSVEDTPDILTWRQLAYPDPDYREETYLQWQADIQSAIKTNNLIPARLYRIHDKWGNERVVSIQASIIGQRIFATFMDMTVEEQIKQAIIESEKRYRTLFDNAMYSIVIYNLDGSIQSINKLAAQKLGHEPDEMIGHLLETFYPGSHDNTMAFIAEVVQNNDITYVENEVDNNGEHAFIWSVAQPLYDSNGDVDGIQVVSHDITAQRQAEVFEQQQEQLQLNLDKQRQISELRTRLLTTISHEFRTPLTIIQTNTEMLMRYRDRLSIDRQDQKLTQIIAQIRHLTTMLDNVRNMSKAQQNQIDYHSQPVDLNAFVDDVVRHFSESKPDTQLLNVDITSETAHVVFDSNLIEQALMNLLNNASKYSDEDGTIHLTIQQSGTNTQFIVRDEGIGISRNDLSHIYQPFFRGKNAENMRGTGLGLAIVREIVDLHRGTITCDSQLDTGTTFTINISSNLV